MTKVEILLRIETLLDYRVDSINTTTERLRNLNDEVLRISLARQSIKEINTNANADQITITNDIMGGIIELINSQQEELISMAAGRWTPGETPETPPGDDIGEDDPNIGEEEITPPGDDIEGSETP